MTKTIPGAETMCYTLFRRSKMRAYSYETYYIIKKRTENTSRYIKKTIKNDKNHTWSRNNVLDIVSAVENKCT